MDFIWESVILVSVGTLLLRMAGRKSISQMTVAQTVVMISIGSIIIQPIIERSVWRTIGAAAIFIGFLVFMEFIQVHSNWMEKLLTGNAKIVIQDGEIIVENLKKLRFTVDQLEMRLRQNGITNVADVKKATLEPNGMLGYELMPHAKPLTVGEFQQMMGSLIKQNNMNNNQEYNLFNEVENNMHNKDIPKNLE